MITVQFLTDCYYKSIAAHTPVYGPSFIQKRTEIAKQGIMHVMAEVKAEVAHALKNSKRKIPKAVKAELKKTDISLWLLFWTALIILNSKKRPVHRQKGLYEFTRNCKKMENKPRAAG